MALLASLRAWIEANGALLRWLGGASAALLVVTPAVLAIVVAKLPEDYFTQDRRDPAHRGRKYPVFWSVIAIAKNLLGVVLILAGLAMILLPGQGVLTILIGLALTNFPGKFALERRIVQRPSVSSALNRIRHLAGRPPLLIPAE